MNKIILLLALSFFYPANAANEMDSSAAISVAVTEFAVLGDSHEFEWVGESCADGMLVRLTTEKNIRIVERKYLETIINELKFQESGIVSEKTAVELGKLTGARYFIMGSASILKKTVVLRARLVNVETAEILYSSELTGIIDELFQLQTELARSIAIKMLGKTIIQNSSSRTDVLSLPYSSRSKLNRLKKLSQSLPLFALDPARKRKAAEYTTAGMLSDGIIESNPEISTGYYFKALFSIHAEEFEEADDALRSAMQRDPNDLEILLVRSMYLFHLQKYQEAKMLLTFLSSRHPRDSRIWFGLAKVSARLNEHSAVIESLVHTLEYPPYLPQAEPMLQTYITQQHNSPFSFSDPAYQKVVSLFRKLWVSGDELRTDDIDIVLFVKKTFPNLYLSYFLEGKIQTTLGNKNAAVKSFQQSLEVMPANPLVHRELAYLYLDLRACLLGKQHATLYLQTSQSVDDFKEVRERVERCN